jgi:hypothetical protein
LKFERICEFVIDCQLRIDRNRQTHCFKIVVIKISINTCVLWIKSCFDSRTRLILIWVLFLWALYFKTIFYIYNCTYSRLLPVFVAVWLSSLHSRLHWIRWNILFKWRIAQTVSNGNRIWHHIFWNISGTAPGISWGLPLFSCVVNQIWPVSWGMWHLSIFRCEPLANTSVPHDHHAFLEPRLNNGIDCISIFHSSDLRVYH